MTRDLSGIEDGLHERLRAQHQPATPETQRAMRNLVGDHLQGPAALRLATEQVELASQEATMRLLPKHAAQVRQNLQGQLMTAILTRGLGR